MKKRVFAMLLLAAWMLSSCGHSEEDIGRDTTVGQTETSLPETNATETPYPTVSVSQEEVLLLRFFDCSDTKGIVDYVSNYRPDVFTVDHAGKTQVEQLTVDGYTAIGEPECEGGEYAIIFYRNDRVEPIKSNTIWLTDTPSEPSKWEKGEDPDICTYALFSVQNGENSSKFALFHASLDPTDAVREKQLICLYAKYACYKDYFPTVLITDDGSIDSEEGNPSILRTGGGLERVAEGMYTAHIEKNAPVFLEDKQEHTLGVATALHLSETPYQIDLDGRFVALTFDDGPRIDTQNHAYTEKVLESLQKYNRKATFFVVGERLKNAKQADLLAAEFAAGHEIGNHTYSHSSYTSMSGEELLAELAKTDELVSAITGGIPTLLYRAPGGNGHTDAKLIRPLVNWSVDTVDWSQKSTPESVFEVIKKDISDGGIVLMHDLRANSPAILDSVLEWLDTNGYQAVTVSEMYEFSGIEMDSNHVYYSVRSVKERPMN